MDIKGLITGLIETYMYVVLIRVVISWINPDPHNPIVQFLRGVTDPAIEAVRRIVPSFLWSTGLDFTPLILILLLQAAIMLLNRIYI
ncbi:MAG: YggT family protein [Gemmatimonadetes bacterium]|jgi:YggT family protein|nr:YggT family protein [Gemmatimonadota bacterium]MBT5327110.1 YggT family protein [Gemmatimonadota bacterium]MBT5449520.1 YggT family protein [Gemmatimonadota bacterium]MBT5802403.1 YggT family protein [Gemmatimonadota bacterium]MBT6619787.1 YggT family protein [Gemmatimonadota bacterium]|tara:strand:- start:854 stop:1114 length:261 start_codon:yes stop_codon:yes gene_type:complete